MVCYRDTESPCLCSIHLSASKVEHAIARRRFVLHCGYFLRTLYTVCQIPPASPERNVAKGREQRLAIYSNTRKDAQIGATTRFGAFVRPLYTRGWILENVAGFSSLHIRWPNQVLRRKSQRFSNPATGHIHPNYLMHVSTACSSGVIS